LETISELIDWNSWLLWPTHDPCPHPNGILIRLLKEWMLCHYTSTLISSKKGKGSPYSITERRVPELIPVLGSQPAGDVSHKPGGRLPLLSARPAVTPATLKMAATNFAAW